MLVEEKSQVKMYILYWHLVGGETFQKKSLKNYIQQIISGEYLTDNNSGIEQFLFKMTSNKAFEDLVIDSGFRKIVASLTRNGVYEQ